MPSRSNSRRAIDDIANQRVLALDKAMAAASIAGVTETVPTYRSLLVHYDPVRIDFEALGAKLAALAQTARSRRPARRGAGAFPSPMAAKMASTSRRSPRALNITPDEVVARHAGGDYRVAMIGFTPGWSYLSGLDKSLHMPRRLSPRVFTPAGTISIGGVQAGIQCLAAPSGWHLLGRTAVRTFQLHRDPVFLTSPATA